MLTTNAAFDGNGAGKTTKNGDPRGEVGSGREMRYDGDC
jgi:hypothetical protein